MYICTEDDLWKVTCGDIYDYSNKVCKLDGKHYCCADDKDDCCDVNDGALAGVIIGCIVAFLLIVLACCACFPCCPLHKRCRGSGAPPAPEAEESA